MRATRIFVIHVFHKDSLLRTLVIKSRPGHAGPTLIYQSVFVLASPKQGENKNTLHHAALLTKDEQYTVWSFNSL